MKSKKPSKLTVLYSLETAILFEKKMNSLNEDEILDLSDLPSDYIPLLSRLLLVKKITVSSNKLQAELNKLPFLDECFLQKA